MNYIELINNFWQKDIEHNFSDREVALYFYLLSVSNSINWKNPFGLSNALTIAKFGWGKKSFDTAKNNLKLAGLISFRAGDGRGNIYQYEIIKVSEKVCQKTTLLENESEKGEECKKESVKDTQKVTLLDTLSDTLLDTLSEQKGEASININKTKQKEEIDKENKPLSIIPTKNEVIDFFMSLEELKPAEAESLAESFFSHWTVQNWRDGKSIIFDWVESARNWKGEPKEKKELTTRFTPPTVEEVKAYCEERANSIDAQHFVDHYTANGWKRGNTKLKDWKACVRTWEKNNFNNSSSKGLSIVNHDNTKTYEEF